MLYVYCYVIFFPQPHPWHMEVPRPGTESEPQLWPTLKLQQHWILWPTVPQQELQKRLLSMGVFLEIQQESWILAQLKMDILTVSTAHGLGPVDLKKKKKKKCWLLKNCNKKTESSKFPWAWPERLGIKWSGLTHWSLNPSAHIHNQGPTLPPRPTSSHSYPGRWIVRKPHLPDGENKCWEK